MSSNLSKMMKTLGLKDGPSDEDKDSNKQSDNSSKGPKKSVFSTGKSRSNFRAAGRGR